MSVPFDVFGPGYVWATRTDVANSTPINIGYAQELSIDFNANIKELVGQNQYPLDVARGITKIQWKIKAAVLSGIAFNNVFFGSSFTTGSFKVNIDPAAAIPGSPFQITVVNAATYENTGIYSVAGGDLGVTFQATGLPLTKVASAPATKQYSVNAATGVYTFAAADTGLSVIITYRSTTVAGQTLNVTNQLLGFTPIVQIDYYTTRNNSPFLVRMPQATANKITLATKLEDFLMPEFDGGAFANASGVAVEFAFPEVS